MNQRVKKNTPLIKNIKLTNNKLNDRDFGIIQKGNLLMFAKKQPNNE